jgi:membrane fusion protein, heavy metal efflux system
MSDSVLVDRPSLPSIERGRSGFLAWLRSAAPTACVLLALGGLAFWGHRNGWALPKLSALLGRSESVAADWCQDHHVPMTQCIECDKTLLPASPKFGWCAEHGVAQCPWHHPELAQTKSVVTVTDADFDQARAALELRPRAKNNSNCQLHERRVQFASIEALNKAGVDIAIAKRSLMTEAITANGEVVYDATRSARLASRVTGSVYRVERRVGDVVRQGDVLALIDAAEVGRAKEELLQAIAQQRLTKAHVERLEGLGGTGAVAGRQVLEARAAADEARIRLIGADQALVNLGFPALAEDSSALEIDEIAARLRTLGLPEAMSSVAGAISSSNLIPLRSPLDGVVVSADVVAGEMAAANASLFEVADVSRLWLLLDVRAEDAKYVRIGQPARFRAGEGADEKPVEGAVSWISTAADDVTRTVRVRVDLTNEDGRLRANTFGTGQIVLRENPSAIVVPDEAIHHEGCCHIVFVRDKNFLRDGSPKFFHVRQVRAGAKDADGTEVIAGLLPGEVVAAKNSVVLRWQLLKGNLGAGCCEACMPVK